MIPLLLVAALGGLGAATRFVVDGAVRSRWSGPWPVATIAINVTGSLVLGLAVGAGIADAVASGVVAGVAAFCGGYTTFSTAMVETVRLVRAGDVRRALGNAVGTAVLTVAAAAVGVRIASALL